MNKTVFVLTLAVMATAASADTIFDAIYADAAQTTLRTNALAPTNKPSYFSANKAIGGYFTTGSASSTLRYIEFLYENTNTAALSSTPFSGTVQIFSTVNPELITTPNSANPAFSGLLTTSTFSLTSSLAAQSTGIAGFSLPTSLNLDASHTYGFTIKIDSATIQPTFTYGPTYGTGTTGLPNYNNVVFADNASQSGAQIPVRNGVSFNSSAPKQNVGFALYTAAPQVQTTPEPATLAALGLGSFTLLRRRKRA